MNNTKLEIVRINEDVIVTSGICSHINATSHIYVETVDTSAGGKEDYYATSYNPTTGKIEFGPKYQADINVTETGWYYYNDGLIANIKRCEDQSKEAHPCKPN